MFRVRCFRSCNTAKTRYGFPQYKAIVHCIHWTWRKKYNRLDTFSLWSIKFPDFPLIRSILYQISWFFPDRKKLKPFFPDSHVGYKPWIYKTQEISLQTISDTGDIPTDDRGRGKLEHRTGDRVVLGSNPAAATSLRNFGNSVYPALPVSFGGHTKSRWSHLSGVCARGSKRSHTGGKCVTCCRLHILT